MRKKLMIVALMVIFYVSGCGQNATGEEQPKPTLPSPGGSLFETQPGVEKIDLSGGGQSGFLEDPAPLDVATKNPYKAKEYLELNHMEELGMIERDMGFCVDETTGDIYFVNLGKDGYIYRSKERKTELVVELPAKELCMWNGTLYFMLEPYDKYELVGGKKGDIYAYCPAKGTVTLVYEAGTLLSENGQRLCCDEFGLYFSEVKIEMVNGYPVATEKFYHLPYGASEPVKDTEESTFPGWGEYRLNYVSLSSGEFDYVLVHRSKKVDKIIDLGIENLDSCWIVGDELYYSTGLIVGIKNLVTGEIEEFDFSPAIAEEGSLYYAKELLKRLERFTRTDDYIFATDGNFFLKYDTESSEITGGLLPKYISALYTTGNEIYARCQTGEIVRIMTEQEIKPATEENLFAWTIEVEALVE